MAMAFAFGFSVKRKKLGYSIYGVMLVAFLIGACVNVSQEMGGYFEHKNLLHFQYKDLCFLVYTIAFHLGFHHTNHLF